MPETQSIVGKSPPRTLRDPQLFLVFQAQRPRLLPLRASLAELIGVAIGRGSATACARPADGSPRLEITVDDPSMSSAHARLAPALGKWHVEDAGSKNGTLVNGEPLAGTRILADGDIIEMGHTFFRFRAEVAVVADDPPVVVAGERAPGPGLFTLWPQLERQFANLARVARTTVPIVIRGPTGAGKEIIARAAHSLSGRTGAFVPINCGALPDQLVESELFGYRRGAFTGAVQDRSGLIRDADGGTLFLDEVGELSPRAQVVFLRALQESEVVPVGGSRSVPVDLRIVSATHRDLETMKSIREDFCHRLSGFVIELPPLRDRIEDLGILVASLLGRHLPEPAEVSFDIGAARSLIAHTWPGNVRELERCLVTALALGGGEITVEQLGKSVAAATPPDLAPRAPVDVEINRDLLVDLLTAHRGNIAAVARELGKAPIQIRRWLKQHDIDPDRFRGR